MGNCGGNSVIVAVWNQRVDGDDFRTHIEEDGENAEPQIREAENAGFLAVDLLLLFHNFRQMSGFDEEYQRDEHSRHDEVGDDDAVGELLQHSFFLRKGAPCH